MATARVVVGLVLAGLACGDKSVAFYELLDDHAKLIHSQGRQGVMQPFWPCGLSRNGRLAAYQSEGRVTVLRIPSFQTALQVDANPFFDLSPDGRLLATEDDNRFATRLYRIPEEGKKE